MSENGLGDCQYRHDWIEGKCNTCGATLDSDELLSAAVLLLYRHSMPEAARLVLREVVQRKKALEGQ